MKLFDCVNDLLRVTITLPVDIFSVPPTNKFVGTVMLPAAIAPPFRSRSLPVALTTSTPLLTVMGPLNVLEATNIVVPGPS